MTFIVIFLPFLMNILVASFIVVFLVSNSVGALERKRGRERPIEMMLNSLASLHAGT